MFWEEVKRKGQGCEILEPSQVLLGLMHDPVHVPGLLNSQENVGAFQKLPWTSHSAAFLFELPG